MSYKTQVALGKNTTLQRQLEAKFVEFKRSLKFSRRRLGVLEEECLTALYKLIVDTKETNDGDKSSSNNKIQAVPRQTKSANPRLRREQSYLGLVPPARAVTPDQVKRSPTSMSGKNYRQSYSFIRNGLNIDQSRRDRFLRTKKQNEDKAIEIRRGNVHWATKDEFEDRPKAVSYLISDVRDTDAVSNKEDRPARPFTTEPYSARTNVGKLLKRELMINTSKVQSQTLFKKGASTPATDIQSSIGSVLIQTPREPAPKIIQNDQVEIHGDDKQTIASKRNCNTPDGEASPIAVRISITKLNHMQQETAHVEAYLHTSYKDTSAPEDEFLPLGNDDKRHLESIMSEQGERDCVDGFQSSSSKSPRPMTQSGSRSRLSRTPTAEVKNVEETAMKTQSFLTSYAKKSKLLGYVVKSRSSSAAPREKAQKTYRSPCITYQELVSIKANIKQQESRTRLLLQRSAKLTKYVDKLANAGNVRWYIQSQNMKQ